MNHQRTLAIGLILLSSISGAAIEESTHSFNGRCHADILKTQWTFLSIEQGEFGIMNYCLVKPWIAGVTLMQSVAAVALEDVPVAYLIIAKSHQVPVDILYAIAMTESGTHYRGERVPWPWALNIDGQSVFCESQQDAIHRVSQAIRNQLNWIQLLIIVA